MDFAYGLRRSIKEVGPRMRVSGTRSISTFKFSRAPASIKKSEISLKRHQQDAIHHSINSKPSIPLTLTSDKTQYPTHQCGCDKYIHEPTVSSHATFHIRFSTSNTTYVSHQLTNLITVDKWLSNSVNHIRPLHWATSNNAM